MKERFDSIKQEILAEIEKNATSRATAFEVRKQFLDSKTGKIGQLMKEMRNIAPEERAEYGKGVNELKECIDKKIIIRKDQVGGSNAIIEV